MSVWSRFGDRFRVLVALLVTLIHLPALAWLCARAGNVGPVLAASAISLPYLRTLERPWSPSPPRATTYLALGWWCACVTFDLLMLPAWLAVRAGAPAPWVWGAAWALALAIGADAVTTRPRTRRFSVRIPGLPGGLQGLRIGQLSDIHCGPHVPEHRVRRWVERLNALDVDVIAVTGDLIAHGAEYVEAVARALGGLRARAGVFVSLGNHDYFTDAERFVRTLERHGVAVLRNRGVVIPRGDAQLYVAGVDDTWTGRDDVERALAARPPGTPTVLLAHDPELFAQAARHGVELTLSGHTHGGQLQLPALRQLSLARLMTRWTAGLYRVARSWLYVNRGAGTTGPPVRLFAPPELAVITLRAA